jgi:PE family
MATSPLEPDESSQPNRSLAGHDGFRVDPAATKTTADHLDQTANLLAELESILLAQGSVTAPGVDSVSVGAGKACQAVGQEQLAAINSGQLASRNLAESLRRHTASHQENEEDVRDSFSDGDA